MTTDKKTQNQLLVGAIAIGLITGASTFAIANEIKTPETRTVSKTSTVTDTTTEPKLVTKTERKTYTETPAPRTVTETQVARSADRSELPQNANDSSANSNTTSPEAPAPQPTNTAAQNSSSGAAECIAKYESGGNVNAVNPASGASGKWQFLDSTWQSVTGLPGKASDYPESVQRQAFDKLWAGGAGSSHWVTAGKCGY